MEGSTELRKQMDRFLPQIDALLAEQGSRISSRPFDAACIMVKNFITIEGETKDGFFTKPWFTPIYWSILEWYEDRYGNALALGSQPVGIGVIVVHGTPFEVRIPLILEKLEKPGELVWVTLPNGVLQEENVRDWVTTPPNWSSISSEDLVEVDNRVTSVGRRIRSIHMDLISVEYKSENGYSLAGTIEPLLYAAALKIVSSNYADSQLAFGDIQLAVEKAMKLTLIERGLHPPKTHDLERLSQLLATQGLEINRDALNLLPSDEQILELRYGTRCKNLGDVIMAYETMLDIVSPCTASLERSLVYDNPSFLMRIPLWAQRYDSENRRFEEQESLRS